MHLPLSRTTQCLSSILIALSFSSLLSTISALGINCRGSGLCPRATFNNQNTVSIIQLLRDVVWASSKSNSTTYSNGDHVICVSQNEPITISLGFTGPSIDGFGAGASLGLSGAIDEGGICLFPQSVQGGSITLGQIRPLTDAILNHKCTTCGSVPIHFVDEGSNDPSDGILTFNYVAAPICDGNCISDLGSSDSGQSSQPTAQASSFAPSSTIAVAAAPSTSSIAQAAAATSSLSNTESAAASSAPSIAQSATATIISVVTESAPASSTSSTAHSTIATSNSSIIHGAINIIVLISLMALAFLL